MDAREEILERIRQAVTGAPEAEIVREYRTELDVGDLVTLFAERAADYRAVVHVLTGGQPEERITELTSGKRMIVPDGLPWADAVSRPETDLHQADGVITGCALAIADTGTIVLDTGPGQGSRAQTLLPDYHLCVVEAAQIVAGIPEALPKLDPARPLTWISGPSATSDIELDRVEGVHGPRNLEILICLPREGRGDSSVDGHVHAGGAREIAAG